MEMNERQALQIIEEMISATKEEVKDNGFYYMLWGWLVFIAAFIDYLMIFSPWREYHAIVWAVMMPAGGVVSFVAGRKEARQVKVKTYIHEAVNALTTAFVISLIIVCVIMPMTTDNWRSFFPTLMVIYAFAIFTLEGCYVISRLNTVL
jgi:CHASE2 domain-containing sensor protein